MIVERSLFPPLSAGVRRGIEELLPVIEKTFPLKWRFSAALPKNISRLSALLTKERSELNGSYMSDPVLFNAYLRYFLPWNVWRLSRLLPALRPEVTSGTAEIVDLGSGPLTLPVAVWIALPELRRAPLRFHCVDRNGAALEAGVKLFHALSAESGEKTAWQVKTYRAALGERLKLPPAAMVCAVNVCNELFQKLPQAGTAALAVNAKKFAHSLSSLASDSGRILVVEPGAPRPAQFLSLLRGEFIGQGLSVEAPCPSSRACAMMGGRRGQKWCHFNIEADGAPPLLHKLSAAAALPKEKVTLSFLLVSKKTASRRSTPGILDVRVISDAFPLPGGMTGRYGCCEKGLALLSGDSLVEKYRQGSFLQLEMPTKTVRDAKSGALVIAAD
ncbi:MAG: rRNA methyltransferase [Spirochaetaceae bacterium]|jgi:ribosomal protein RSM22 (predicted rRNA methylase)|nr:rRNA methyltransferase [Spirochaetaceae bacterium]